MTNNRSWSYFNVGITPPPTVSFTPNFSSLNPTITVSKPGLYGFVLKETNQFCGATRDTVYIYSKQMIGNGSDISPSCEGDTDGAIVASGNGATSFSYDNGLTWTADSTLSNLSAGTYDVCVKDNQGCEACSQVIISDPAPVQLSVGNDTIVCENGTANLNAIGQSGNTFTYHWSHTSNTTAAVTAAPIAAGYYTVYVENENGCSSAMDSIYVDVLPPLSVTVAGGDEVCPGYPSTISVYGAGGDGGPYNFTWSNTMTGTGQDNSITVTLKFYGRLYCNGN